MEANADDTKRRRVSVFLQQTHHLLGLLRQEEAELDEADVEKLRAVMTSVIACSSRPRCVRA